MNKLYEIIIGEDRVIDVAEVPATETAPAVPASQSVEHIDRVDLKTVSAVDAEEAIAKLKPTLAANQHIESVSKLNNIDVS